MFQLPWKEQIDQIWDISHTCFSLLCWSLLDCYWVCSSLTYSMVGCLGRFASICVCTNTISLLVNLKIAWWSGDKEGSCGSWALLYTIVYELFFSRRSYKTLGECQGQFNLRTCSTAHLRYGWCLWHQYIISFRILSPRVVLSLLSVLKVSCLGSQQKLAKVAV